MYELTLLLHSWLRWLVLLTGAVAVLSALSAGDRSHTAARADCWGLFFTISLDIQFLLGLLLYFFLSPTTAAIFDNLGAAMGDRVARFWAVEHVTAMVIGIAVAHMGRVLARKATDPSAKRARLVLCFTLSLIAILAGIPWPGMSAGRPLFRF